MPDNEGLSIRDLVLEVRDDVKALRKDLSKHVHTEAIGRKEMYGALLGMVVALIAIVTRF